tara:strand:- start:1146 stop:1553 length:408 start_codon:yes stop_codon:yes gene_type:complete
MLHKENFKKKRLEYLQSVEFDRHYYVPIEDYDKFLNDPNLNIENYRNECYVKKQEMNRIKEQEDILLKEEQDYIDERNIYSYYYNSNKYIDEYSLNGNEYFYKDEIFIDEEYYNWKFNYPTDDEFSELDEDEEDY